jgi:tetrahydromethanopterin S-methyltransferase subunit B|tara:strand:- start:1413 stop:2000 length:588 start_codon:yes stop_codon:yes gene_type:complete
MDIVDLIITIIIFLVFSIVYFFNFYFTGMKAIQDGWETKGYKCNPIIIPFTATIWAGTPEANGDTISAHTKRSAEANFADCVKNLTEDNLEILLKPIKDSLGSLTKIAGNVTSSMDDMLTYMDSFRDTIGNMTGGLSGIFGNMLGSFNASFGEIGKLGESVTAVMYILMYIMQTTILLAQSLFDGPIGGAMKMLG